MKTLVVNGGAQRENLHNNPFKNIFLCHPPDRVCVLISVDFEQTGLSSIMAYVLRESDGDLGSCYMQALIQVLLLPSRTSSLPTNTMSQISSKHRLQVT